MKIALQMDHPRKLNPRSDSTIVLGLEAQKRGHELFFYTPEKLTLQNGELTANAHPITLSENPENFYTLGAPQRINLATMNVVLLRQDPPFNMAYITSTYLLEMLPKTTLVANNPTSVRNHPEKLLPFMWPQFMPPTLITADLSEIEAFRKEHRDIIIKPVYGHGGRAILRLKEDDGNLAAIVEMHTATSKEPLMVQRFLPEVKTKDCRIFLIDGEFAGAFARIPSETEIRANLRVGGHAEKIDLTSKQKEICEALKPVLKQKNLLFAGLDLIGDFLTEINITSPTGLVPLSVLYNKNLAADIWNVIEAKSK